MTNSKLVKRDLIISLEDQEITSWHNYFQRWETSNFVESGCPLRDGDESDEQWKVSIKEWAYEEGFFSEQTKEIIWK